MKTAFTDTGVRYQGVVIPKRSILKWARRIDQERRSMLPNSLRDQMNYILAVVLEESGVSRDRLMRRKADATCARFISMLLMREYTIATHEQLAWFVYGSAHDASLYAVESATDRIGIYPEYTALYRACSARMKGERVRELVDQAATRTETVAGCTIPFDP